MCQNESFSNFSKQLSASIVEDESCVESKWRAFKRLCEKQLESVRSFVRLRFSLTKKCAQLVSLSIISPVEISNSKISVRELLLVA